MPLDPSSFSVKETVEVVEQRLPGGKILIPLVLYLALVALALWLARSIFENGVQPFSEWVARRGQVDQWTAVISVVAAGFVAYGMAAFVLYRRIRQWKTGIASKLGELMDLHGERINDLHNKAADAHSVREAVQAIHNRLGAIEPSKLSPSDDEHAYYREALMRALDAPRIDTVKTADMAPRFSTTPKQ
jgi:hypothetical protein